MKNIKHTHDFLIGFIVITGLLDLYNSIIFYNGTGLIATLFFWIFIVGGLLLFLHAFTLYKALRGNVVGAFSFNSYFYLILIFFILNIILLLSRYIPYE